MSTDFNLDATGIIRNAFQMAGIVPDGQDPDSAQFAKGRDLLNVIVKALQSEGIILVTLTRVTIPLVAGTASYTLPGNTLDVATDHPFVTQGGGNPINVPLAWWSRDQYMTLTVPGTLSQPTSIYVEKTQPLTANLYPVPDSTWASMTLPVVALLPDLTAGTDETSLQAKYLDALIMKLAHRLALSAGLLPRANALKVEYEEAKRLATSDDSQRGNLKFKADYSHLGRWPRSY